MKKFLFILLAATMLCGCKAKEIDRPDESKVVSVEEVKLSLENFERPKVVEELKKPDKTLASPMFSLSTEAFSTVQVLSENDYFKYDLLNEADFEELNKITEPTNVSVTLFRDVALTDWSVRFSCFIYKIDPDYIYLGTAGHCVITNSDVTRAKVTFFDRTEINVSLADYKMGSGFAAANGDYAMYRIPTNAIPGDLLLKLKEVNYDEAAISAVKAGDVLFTGNIYCASKTTDYDKTMTVFDKSTEWLMSSLSNYNVYLNQTYFLTDTPLVGGQSGSAIFDKSGNLVAICSGGSYDRKVGIYTVADKMDDMYNSF